MQTDTCQPISKVDQRSRPVLLPASHPVDDPTLPKARDNKDDGTRSSPSRRCGLVQCRKLVCDMRSHRQYAALQSKSQRSKEFSSTHNPNPNLRRKPDNQFLDHAVARIERQIADGFPSLPFKSGSSSIFKELVHHYFRYQIDRLISIHSPHLDRRKYKSTMMDHALSNDVFCVCIAANARTDMLMRGHIRKPDRNSEFVYGMTAQVLRHKLSSFRLTDADWLLVLVIALVGFDLAFERLGALKAHHAALQQLVSMKGGIHTVGHTLPYVLNTDRFLAVFTGQYPVFKSTHLVPASPTYNEEENPYGEALGHYAARGDIDPAITGFCSGLCQLFHLMESTRLSLDPKSTPASDPSAVPYFLYLRDRLLGEGTVLHADYHENRMSDNVKGSNASGDETSSGEKPFSKSRCILLVTLMIEYQVAHANYYTIKGTFLASECKSVLDKLPVSEWESDVDLAIWVLFVTAAIPEQWEHHQWALCKLIDQLDIKYKDCWPYSGWKEDIDTLLKSFVWSKTLDMQSQKLFAELIVARTS